LLVLLFWCQCVQDATADRGDVQVAVLMNWVEYNKQTHYGVSAAKVTYYMLLIF
jgi:hypothetical protein